MTLEKKNRKKELAVKKRFNKIFCTEEMRNLEQVFKLLF